MSGAPFTPEQERRIGLLIDAAIARLSITQSQALVRVIGGVEFKRLIDVSCSRPGRG